MGGRLVVEEVTRGDDGGRGSGETTVGTTCPVGHRYETGGTSGLLCEEEELSERLRLTRPDEGTRP